MTKAEFFQEMEKAANAKALLVEKIKSHGLPVIIFGAGTYAVTITKMLNRYGLEVSGYAVDEEYYQPDKIFLNRPIYNFAELYRKPKDQIFFLAFGKSEKIPNAWEKFIKRRDELINDENIIEYHLLPTNTLSGWNISYEFFLENKDKFFEAYNLLSDDWSKKTMLFYLKAHISEMIDGIENIFDPQKEYFNDLTSPALQQKGIYIDCGAFRGDTIENFIKWSGDNYSEIFAFEPDIENFSALEKFVETRGYKNISLFNCGVWNKKETLKFLAVHNSSSNISEYGDIEVETESIDNVVNNTPPRSVSLIKMDVEGAELNALKGAVKTLKNSRPILAISVYHKPEDLITIPQFIKDVYKNCRFYLRKHEGFNLWEFDLYVIPE